MRRRDLMIGAACVTAAAVAEVARPHRHTPLLPKGAVVDDMVPRTFGTWVSEDVGDPLAINGPDSLAAKLYNQLVTRVYTDTTTSTQIMMLLAYGADQTDDLQLHRPEICYPAFGYTLLRNEPAEIAVGDRARLPARRLIARSDQRREAIMYWTRMGELLPASGTEQRKDRLLLAMQGVIPDGVLCRFSTVAEESSLPWRGIERFIPAMLTAMTAKNRPVFVGTTRAQLIA